VSSDGRYQKTFWKARNTVIETIKKLLKIAPVMVMAIYGNHDTLSSWHLADSIECYFHDNPDVKVQNDPTYRKYYEYGRNMIMFTHGDKGKRDDYPALMAAERSAMFGRTQFREVHCGHTHETKMEEYHGVRVRILPALCPADSWHAENGYVGNLRNAEAYIWNKNEGLIGTAIYNVDSQPEITTKREIVKRGK
jgi:DNA repair exonuclease SbcCD nuclease subunit